MLSIIIDAIVAAIVVAAVYVFALVLM